MLNRDQILGAEDIKIETVDVPEWGGTVRVRTLTAADRLRVVGTVDPKVDTRIIYVAAALIDDKGEPLMTAADIPALMVKSAKATDRVYEVVARLNGLGTKATGDAEKN